MYKPVNASGTKPLTNVANAFPAVKTVKVAMIWYIKFPPPGSSPSIKKLIKMNTTAQMNKKGIIMREFAMTNEESR